MQRASSSQEVCRELITKNIKLFLSPSSLSAFPPNLIRFMPSLFPKPRPRPSVLHLYDVTMCSVVHLFSLSVYHPTVAFTSKISCYSLNTPWSGFKLVAPSCMYFLNELDIETYRKVHKSYV